MLSACSTSEILPPRAAAPAEEAPLASQTVTGLPAQRLQPGQCGVFLFETRDPNAFVLFEDEAEGVVQILHFGQVYTIRLAAQGAPFLSGEPFNREYRAADAGLIFTVDGLVGLQTSSGQRLTDVVLTALQPDGTRIVRPLGGVRRCQGG